MLPSLNLPPKAYPPSTIPKSAPAKAPECSTEFFPEDQEESTPITEKEQTGPIKMVSPSPSDSEDSTTEDQEKDQLEQEKSKPTRENMEKSFPLFEQSLKAHENWLERTEMDNEAPLLEVTEVSEGEDNQELLDAIEELERESETEVTKMI